MVSPLTEALVTRPSYARLFWGMLPKRLVPWPEPSANEVKPRRLVDGRTETQALREMLAGHGIPVDEGSMDQGDTRAEAAFERAHHNVTDNPYHLSLAVRDYDQARQIAGMVQHAARLNPQVVPAPHANWEHANIRVHNHQGDASFVVSIPTRLVPVTIQVWESR